MQRIHVATKTIAVTDPECVTASLQPNSRIVDAMYDPADNNLVLRVTEDAGISDFELVRFVIKGPGEMLEVFDDAVVSHIAEVTGGDLFMVTE